MCGIAGQVKSAGGPVERELLGRMCSALAHRGPDARGIHLSDGVGLGCQRLRVIDLETGDQPIFNEDRSIVVVLNGEIYNYRELRDRLLHSGHRFDTECDTEVIAHLYEEQGAGCVSDLHGMFAFALWDGRRRQLMLARDRVGKKPLFYAEREGSITFASELNALMRDASISRQLDHVALDCYVAYQYIPAPLCAFQGVRKLPPATTLLYSREGTKVERYWHLDYGAKRSLSEAELHEEIRDGIRRAVRRRMIADVPLGAFLSGGIDSSCVVAAMAEASVHPVRTFSIGFESDRFNELEHARRIARMFGTDHREHVVRPDAIAMIPKIVSHYGEPFGDSSAVPSFYLAEMARRDVTVALNGDGGDESFAGYPRYTSNLASYKLQRLPFVLRRSLAMLGGRLPASGKIDSSLSRVRRLSGTLPLSPPERYIAYLTSLGGLNRDALYADGYRELVGESVADDVVKVPWRDSSASELVDIMLDVDVGTYLPGDLLVKMDIATMAYSLEARSPLLDHELMELAASIPAHFKVRGLEKKVALRDALRGWLPDDILDRPKRGFEVPVAEWLRSDLRDFASDILLGPPARDRGYFDQSYVSGLLQRHLAGIEDHSRGLWSLLMLELWQQEFVDKGPDELLAAAGPAARGRSALP